MSLRSLEFAVSESITGVIRNGLMSMASVTTVGLSLAVLGSFVLLALGLNHAAESQLNKFEIAVWVDQSATQAQVQDMGKKIKAMPHVESADLVTAKATWDKIKRDWRGRIDLNGVQPATLTDHFRVKMDDPARIVDTAQKIRKMGKVEEVIEGRQVVDQVVRFAYLVKVAGGCAAGVLFLIAGFIVSNTIRLTLYARRREIKIMQLVGATNWFIRLPFVFEGTILGAVGAGIACLIIYGVIRYVGQAVTQIMPLLAQFSSGIDPTQFYIGMVFTGCFIGAMGSMMSIRRFLKA